MVVIHFFLAMAGNARLQLSRVAASESVKSAQFTGQKKTRTGRVSFSGGL
jgi:hypothetical protein